MSKGCFDFMFLMSDFLVLLKPEIMTRPGSNSNNAIKPNGAFLLLVHINIWSKRSIKSLIVALKVLDVKKELPIVSVIILILSFIYPIGKPELWAFVFPLVFQIGQLYRIVKHFYRFSALCCQQAGSIRCSWFSSEFMTYIIFLFVSFKSASLSSVICRFESCSTSSEIDFLANRLIGFDLNARSALTFARSADLE